MTLLPDGRTAGFGGELRVAAKTRFKSATEKGKTIKTKLNLLAAEISRGTSFAAGGFEARGAELTLNRNYEPQSTKDKVTINHSSTADQTSLVRTRRFSPAPEALTGGGRREAADRLPSALHPPLAGGETELCEKCGLKSAPARLAGSAMFCPPAWLAIARQLKLSGRELQLVRGVFDDQKDLTLADALGVSVHTIHTHFERLRHKLAVTDRPQLLQRVVQEFLVLTVLPGRVLPPFCVNQGSGRCPFRPWRNAPSPGP